MTKDKLIDTLEKRIKGIKEQLPIHTITISPENFFEIINEMINENDESVEPEFLQNLEKIVQMNDNEFIKKAEEMTRSIKIYKNTRDGPSECLKEIRCDYIDFEGIKNVIMSRITKKESDDE